MSWDFTVDDLRKELGELKEKLAVQGVQVGEQRSKILKKEEELRTTKDNYVETMDKLRREADRALELEEALKRRSEEFINERNTRENVEKALRTVTQEREKEAAAVREAQHILNQMSREANEYREQQEKLAAEKAKLDAQVRMLQGELQKHEESQPPPPRPAARPRASSLTNLNKLTMLEREVEQIRASASDREIGLKSAQSKLSKMQSDLMRVENEKATLEKKLGDNERKLKNSQEDREELEAELEFYRNQNGSSSREDELLARLEEEEKRTGLLEHQLAQASRSSAMNRSADQLQTRLSNEITRREMAEAREADLVREREEALNELDEIKMTLRELETSKRQKDARIRELETQEGILRQQLETSRNSATPISKGVDEGKITEMVNGIARIRAERDELNAHLEFVQMEAHFKTQALEKRLAEQSANAPSQAQMEEYRVKIAHLTNKLNIGKLQVQKLNGAMSAMLIAVQYFDAQSDVLRGEISSVTLTRDLSNADDAALRGSLQEQHIKCKSLETVIESLQDDIHCKSDEIDRIAIEHQALLSSSDEQIARLHLRLSDVDSALLEEKETRSSLEDRVRELEVNLDMAKQELADAQEHCDRLEARQSSDMSVEAATRSLKNEIEELRNRVMRRTEQIGLQQHDIKRLETNMRLTDERLEEVVSELEMAETAKAAMLEDCSTAREEREEAKKALMQAELEIERLAAQVRDAEMEIKELRNALATMDERANEGSRVNQQLVAERDGRINSLMDDLKASETALHDAQMQSLALNKELEASQQKNNETMEGLKKEIQRGQLRMSEQTEQHARELQALVEELEASKLALVHAERALQNNAEQCEQALLEVEQLSQKLDMTGHDNVKSVLLKDTVGSDSVASDALRLLSDLENSKAAYEETSKALLSKEEELELTMDKLRTLSSELDLAKERQEESNRILRLKEKESDESSTELKRLTSELESRNSKERELRRNLEIWDTQLAETNEQLAQVEAEKAKLLSRLAVFETDSDQGLAESASLRSTLETEREQHEQEIKKLEADIASLEAEMTRNVDTSKLAYNSLNARLEETVALLEATKAELEERQTRYNALVEEQRRLSTICNDDVEDLKKQLAAMAAEMETLQCSLQAEVDGRRCEITEREEELQAVLDKQRSAAAVESELRRTLQEYQEQLTEVQSNLTALQDENASMQSEMDNLAGECHRANLKNQSQERQLTSNGRELSEIREELKCVREALSQSEKSGKTAEMNLLLISQQHERTITSLRSQLKEHEKDAERIQKLQQIVGETKEQISEMEGVLRAKCAEIEENDDKFIQLLKEKKKLTGRVESLTKKKNNLQNKLATISSREVKAASPPSRDSVNRISPVEPSQFASDNAQSTSADLHVFASARCRESSRSNVSQPEEQPRRISSSKRRREASPALDGIPITTSLGKKRPLPDDSDFGRASVEARFPDSYEPIASSSSIVPMLSSSSSHAPIMPPTPELTSTPRQRRQQGLRSGFTPVRGQAALRPTLSQPSPVHRSAAAQQASDVISDVTNSPPRPKRVFTAEPGSGEPRVARPAGKGWLGKIRSGGANSLVKNRHQSTTEGNS